MSEEKRVALTKHSSVVVGIYIPFKATDEEMDRVSKAVNTIDWEAVVERELRKAGAIPSGMPHKIRSFP